MRKRNVDKRVWLSKAEAQDLQKKAKKACMSEAGLIRLLIKGYEPKEKPDDRFYDVMRELSARKIAVEDCQISGYDANTLGDQTVMVSYTDDGVTRTAKFKVTVETAAVDKTDLGAKIEEAEKINTEGYTEESVKALQDAIKAAKAVMEKEEATQEEVNEQLKALQTAMDGLKKNSLDLEDTENQKPETNKPVQNPEETNNSGNHKTETNKSDQNPQTGDNNHLGMAWLGMAAALVTILAVLKQRRLKQK